MSKFPDYSTNTDKFGMQASFTSSIRYVAWMCVLKHNKDVRISDKSECDIVKRMLSVEMMIKHTYKA